MNALQFAAAKTCRCSCSPAIRLSAPLRMHKRPLSHTARTRFTNASFYAAFAIACLTTVSVGGSLLPCPARNTNTRLDEMDDGSSSTRQSQAGSAVSSSRKSSRRWLSEPDYAVSAVGNHRQQQQTGKS